MTTTERAGRPDRSRSRSAASDTPSSPTIMKMSYLVLRNRPNRQHRSVGGTSCSLPRGRVPPQAPNSPRPHGARRTPGQGVSWAARRRAHCAHGRDTAVVELMSSPPPRALRAVAAQPPAAGTSPRPAVAAPPAAAPPWRRRTPGRPRRVGGRGGGNRPGAYPPNRGAGRRPPLSLPLGRADNHESRHPNGWRRPESPLLLLSDALDVRAAGGAGSAVRGRAR